MKQEDSIVRLGISAVYGGEDVKKLWLTTIWFVKYIASAVTEEMLTCNP
jgi:hypothetical protein